MCGDDGGKCCRTESAPPPRRMSPGPLDLRGREWIRHYPGTGVKPEKLENYRPYSILFSGHVLYEYEEFPTVLTSLRCWLGKYWSRQLGRLGRSVLNLGFGRPWKKPKSVIRGQLESPTSVFGCLVVNATVSEPQKRLRTPLKSPWTMLQQWR